VTAQAGSASSNVRAERRQLRQRLRAERRALSADERARKDRAIAARVRKLGAFRRADRVGVFLAFDGEPSLAALIAAAAGAGKRLYAPVLEGLRMHFAELSPQAALRKNFFGILEPELGSNIDARRLDLVLTPLVGFDDRGVRLGVGRGYYDRCFSFLLRRAAWQRPKLLGIAYELQHVAKLEREPWDVPLWGAATEAGLRRFGGER
jgi:5-formyltetrahydrofolate cyclo-ligase